MPWEWGKFASDLVNTVGLFASIVVLFGSCVHARVGTMIFILCGLVACVTLLPLALGIIAGAR